MKKIVLTLVAMLSMTATFAANGDGNKENGKKTPEVTVANMVQNYDMTLNYSTLGSILQLNDYQMNAVELIHNKFVNEVKSVENADASERQDLVKEAAGKELKYMSYVLNSKQYQKFSTLLNLTLNNRGLLK
ncbi:MAG: hypothetical protein LIR46_01950 [Bacteroidota bacterium]|jgi:D-alanyl-D-alanine dipeptidase|nr:hypothetical protein [Bacteroidota bacterium]